MNEKMYAKMLDVCCWVARRKFQVGGSLAANLYLYRIMVVVLCQCWTFRQHVQLTPPDSLSGIYLDEPRIWSTRRILVAKVVRSQMFETFMGLVIMLNIVQLRPNAVVQSEN